MRHRSFLTVLCAITCSCSGRDSREAVNANGWRLAFEDTSSGKVAVCDVNANNLLFVTPDSLIASAPATDSSGTTIYFCATQKVSGADGLYSVETDGSGLRKVSDLPFKPSALAVSPSARVILVEGYYEDETSPRLYRVAEEEGRMRALTPAHIPTANPSFSPEGSTFLFNDRRTLDTVWIGFVGGTHPLPLPGVHYSQCSIHRDGLSLVGIAGAGSMELRQYFFATQEDTVLMSVPNGTSGFANPVFHRDGELICLEETASDSSSRIAILDLKTSVLDYLPVPIITVRKPIWVR